MYIYSDQESSSQIVEELSSSSSLNSDRFSQDNHNQQMQSLVTQFNLHLQVEDNTIKKMKTNSQLIPNQEELQDVLQVMRKAFPQSDVYGIIKGLYQRLIPQNLHTSKKIILKSQSQEQSKQRIYKRHPLSKIEANINAVQSLQTYIGFKKVYLESAWKSPGPFTNKHQQMRFRMKNYAARSFVFRGYSLFHFRRQLKAQQDDLFVYICTQFSTGSMYQPYLECVMVQAYRFLQQFITNECQIHITNINRSAMKMICYRLYHCRDSLKPQQCTIFLNIIKIIYGLGNVQLDEYSTIKLYLITQKGIRIIMLKKIIPDTPITDNLDTKQIVYLDTIEGSKTLQLQNIWSIKIEMELIEIYKKAQHFRDIKTYFKNKYPEYRTFFSGPGLNNRFRQIVRICIKKLRDIVINSPQSGMQLIPLTDQNQTYIFNSSRGLKARVMLLDVYSTRQKTLTPRMQAIVQEINDVIADKPYYNYKKWVVSSYNMKFEDISQSGQSAFSQSASHSKWYAPKRMRRHPNIHPTKCRKKSVLFSKVYYHDEKDYAKKQKKVKREYIQNKDRQMQLMDKDIFEQNTKRYDPVFYFEQR